MGDYDDTNRGVLFRNERKREGRKDPDYQGSINIEGVEHWLSAWLKEGRKGKFMSLSIGDVKGARPKGGPKPAKQEEFGGDDEFNDEIPF